MKVHRLSERSAAPSQFCCAGNRMANTKKESPREACQESTRLGIFGSLISPRVEGSLARIPTVAPRLAILQEAEIGANREGTDAQDRSPAAARQRRLSITIIRCFFTQVSFLPPLTSCFLLANVTTSIISFPIHAIHPSPSSFPVDSEGSVCTTPKGSKPRAKTVARISFH